YGVPFGFGEMFQAGAAVFLASLTVASIPYGSIVSLTPAFASTGLPLSGLTLLIGLDRIPDMFRTMTNVTGHLTAAAVVAAVEGEKLEGCGSSPPGTPCSWRCSWFATFVAAPASAMTRRNRTGPSLRSSSLLPTMRWPPAAA